MTCPPIRLTARTPSSWPTITRRKKVERQLDHAKHELARQLDDLSHRMTEERWNEKPRLIRFDLDEPGQIRHAVPAPWMSLNWSKGHANLHGCSLTTRAVSQ